jgi:hypothetical protein
MQDIDKEVLRHWGYNMKMAKEAVKYKIIPIYDHSSPFIGLGFSMSGEDCAYCRDMPPNCDQCPIEEYTGEEGCLETPWKTLDDHLKRLAHDNDPADERFYDLVKEEFLFLVEVIKDREEYN